MEEVTEEPAEMVERVAALDIGKASLVCCVRVPHESKPGARRQEVRTYGTVTPALPAPSSGCPGSSNVGSTTVRTDSTSSRREIMMRGSLRGKMVLAGACLS